MSVDAGSPLAREWAREEIQKLSRLDMVEMECDESSRCVECGKEVAENDGVCVSCYRKYLKERRANAREEDSS